MHVCAYLNNCRSTPWITVSPFNCQHLVKTHRPRAYKIKHQLKLASDNATMALLGNLDSSKATGLHFIQVVHFMQCVWYNKWIRASGMCFQKLQLLVASVVYSHAQFIDLCCTIKTTLSPSTRFWSRGIGWACDSGYYRDPRSQFTTKNSTQR